MNIGQMAAAAALKRSKPMIESNAQSGDGPTNIAALASAAALKKRAPVGESNTLSEGDPMSIGAKINKIKATALKQKKSFGDPMNIGAMITAAPLKNRETVERSNASVEYSTPTRTLKTLSVLTWNVWFGNHRQNERYDFLISRLIELSPDVACFQEVTSLFVKTLKSNSYIKGMYCVTNNPICTYGIISIVKKDIATEIEFHEVDLVSRMGRSLLVTKIPVKIPRLKEGVDETETCYIQVGNVHLESLANESRRRQQLVASSEYLAQDHQSQSTAAMLVGDFNFDSFQTWGDWNQSHPRHSKEQLENTVLAEAMPQWVDAWPYLKGDDPGLTFDGATNPCARDKKERMRYDRIMVRMNSDEGEKLRLEPRGIEMIGTEAIDQTGLKASDHYGLLVKVDIIV
mmetsp:Transcript_5886/g.10112  ORF Transcript_5886/g.10112 Transcript_5886/m.10112 type:complete len:402 (+) Transcript_5886:2-1207(+)